MLRKLREYVYRKRSGQSGTVPEEPEGEEEDSDDITVGWSWPPNKCVDIPDSAGTRGIELRLWATDEVHEEVLNARPYVEYAFADAYGDRYDIEVTVSDTRLPDTISGDTYDDWLWDQDDMAKDGNMCVFQDDGTSPPGLGGGYTSYYAHADKLQGFDPECIKQFGYGDAHFAVNVLIMELGHCLGLGHNGAKVTYDGSKWTGSGDSFVTPMSTGYINAQGYFHSLWADLHDAELRVNG